MGLNCFVKQYDSNDFFVFFFFFFGDSPIRLAKVYLYMPKSLTTITRFRIVV